MDLEGSHDRIGLPWSSGGEEETACNVGDVGSILRSGRPSGEGTGYPLQYSCLENPMDYMGGLQFTGSLGVGHD